MAKKQLKKLNQPRKYLQGGSNMASVAQARQNPYYIGQVNANAAEDKFQSSQDQLAQARLDAAQAQKDARESQNQQLDATVRQNTTNLVKAAATDQKNGRLGNLFSRGPLSGQAALNLSAGAQVAPMYAAPATTTVASNIGSLAPGAVEVGANLANTSTNVVSGVNAATAGVPTIAGPTGEFVTQGIASGAKGAAGLSSLATAGIGASATIGGQLIKRGTNDKSAYTFTDKERRGNVGGSALASAGTGFGIGNMLLPGIGGAIGAGIGAGVGALKARKENKAAEEEADRLQREQSAIRGSYQSAFVNSRLTGADTGFGLNSSTNMNNQFTNQYQVAKLGGIKKVPGGQIVPIEGTDAVEFKGRSHENGGVTIDKNTEVEGGETMDQVAMSNNNKQDYIFSKYLKLGGKSFAQRHKEILKGSGSQADIQQLAAMQEKVAGRDSKQVAAYGGFHKYATGGTPCPDGYEMDSSGNCFPIATSSEGIAIQNGTSNAPADVVVTPSNPKGWGAAGAPSPQIDVDQPAYTEPAGVKPTTPVVQTDNTVAPDGTKLPAGYVWDKTLNQPISATAMSSATAASANKTGTATYTAPTGVTPPPTATTGTQTPANTSDVQGGVGATTTNDKLVGSKTSGFLPTFENAKENPLWTKENYPAWKSEVSSAIADTNRQQKIVDYLSNYKGDYSAEVQKRIKGKTGQDLLTTIQNLATDNKPGIFHEAVRQALEASKPPAVVPPVPPVVPPTTTETPTQELPAKFEPCPPGTYRSGDGTCKQVGDVPQGNRISATLMAGLGQLVPVGAALANPYKIAPGIIGAPSVKGALMPRMNLNQERASAIQQNVAYKNAVVNQNAGPGALAAMQSANANTNQQMMQIAKQEQDANRQLAAEEGKLGMQASMFNAETEQKRQMFNTEFNQGERRYRREDILGALDTGASRIAGIVKDERAFKADERLANALDETGSYDRFTILEQLNKEAKRKNSPYANTTEAERRRIAAAMHKELNPEGYVGKSEYNKLQEEKDKLQKEKEKAEKAGKAKFGGARQYVSRLGQLSGVRATKAKL
jgi:hypothetical protein